VKVNIMTFQTVCITVTCGLAIASPCTLTWSYDCSIYIVFVVRNVQQLA